MGRLPLSLVAGLLAMARRRTEFADEMDDAADACMDVDGAIQLRRAAKVLRLHAWTEQMFATAVEAATERKSRSP